MSVVFTNASLFFAGYSLASQHNQVGLEFEAESLDDTKFGADTRSMKGGLKVARISGTGHFLAGLSGADAPHQVAMDSMALADVVVMLFPEAIAEGATATGSGYMTRAVELKYDVGAAVGELLPFTLSAEGRGAGR